VADLDDDGAIELCVSSDSGHVFLLDLDENAGRVAWSGLGARATRTSLLAQPLSGEIAGSVTLSGEYSVTDYLTVSETGALTLSAGTTLNFESVTTGLIVYGDLEIDGTDDLPVVLTRSDGRGEWPGIALYAGSTVDVRNCVIENATFGMRGQQANVTLTSVETTDGLFGVDLSRSSFSATDCVFSGADSTGVRLTTSSTGTIRNCSVTGTIGRGIELRNRTSCSVVSTTITGVAEGHGIACTKYSDATIDSCTITNSGGHGILASASAPKITGCVITGNGGSGVQCVKVAGPHITRSTITDNNMGVVVEQASTAVLGSNMYPDTGYNSIHGNTRAAVANYNGTESPVYARWNWWGSANPYGRLFVGHVVHNPWLDAPPDERPSLVYGDELPSSLALHPNTPNPFNPSTSLELEIPAGGADVDVAVYDVSGRRVAVLHSGHLEAGRHSLLWTGADERGNTVASGVYFARMVAPGYKHSVRMLLLK